MASGGDAGREGLRFLSGAGHRSLTMLQGVYGQHNWTPFYFSFFLLLWAEAEVTRVGGQTWEAWEVSVIGVHGMKFPNN